MKEYKFKATIDTFDQYNLGRWKCRLGFGYPDFPSFLFISVFSDSLQNAKKEADSILKKEGLNRYDEEEKEGNIRVIYRIKIYSIKSAPTRASNP